MTSQSQVLNQLLDRIFTDTTLYGKTYMPVKALISYVREYYKQNDKTISKIMTKGNFSEAFMSFLIDIVLEKMSENENENQKLEIKKLEDLFSEEEVKTIKRKIMSARPSSLLREGTGTARSAP